MSALRGTDVCPLCSDPGWAETAPGLQPGGARLHYRVTGGNFSGAEVSRPLLQESLDKHTLGGFLGGQDYFQSENSKIPETLTKALSMYAAILVTEQEDEQGPPILPSC